MQKTKIEWCDYTWNPVTGCRRGCKYCYAQRIHNRFNPDIPFSIITFHGERINDPIKIKKPSTIFVGSMSDIEYWNKDITKLIIDTCRRCPQHTFMFLSKNPKSYYGFNWPDNTMQGLTLTCNQSKNCQHTLLLEHAGYSRPYLSIEPLLGELHYKVCFEKVIVGAMTGPNAIEPKEEWIKSIKDNIPNDKIFWKNNIKSYNGE